MTQATNSRPAHLARVDAIRARYTNPAAMLAHIEAADTTAERLLCALASRETATNPRGKFGLEAADTAAVLPVLEGLIAAYRAALAPLAAFVVARRAEGLTGDEIRIRLADSPFAGLGGDRVPLGYLDGTLRGVVRRVSDWTE